jgi:hypothetical protein
MLTSAARRGLRAIATPDSPFERKRVTGKLQRCHKLTPNSANTVYKQTLNYFLLSNCIIASSMGRLAASFLV